MGYEGLGEKTRREIREQKEIDDLQEEEKEIYIKINSFIDKIHLKAKRVFDYYNMINSHIEKNINGIKQRKTCTLPFEGGIMNQPRLFIKKIESQKLKKIEKAEVVTKK